MVELLLEGSSMSAQAISEALLRVKNNIESNHDGSIYDGSSSSLGIVVDELILREVELSQDQVALLIDVIHSRSNNNNNNNSSDDASSKGWKSIQLFHCSGLVNDAILACTSSMTVRGLWIEQLFINAQTTQNLTYGLKYNTQLQSLKLSIRWDVATARSLSTALARNTTLLELSLENSTNWEEHGVVLNVSFGLRLNQQLQSLNLDGCYLEDDQISSILHSLDGHANLRKLSLKRNSCHTKGMAAIATLLHANLLHELDLSFLVRPTKRKTPPPSPPNEEATQREEDKEGDTTVVDVQDDGTTTSDNGENNEAHDDKKPPVINEEEKDEEKVEDDGGDHEYTEEEKETQVRNTSLRVLQMAGNGVGDSFLESVMNIFGKDSKLECLSFFGNHLSSQGIRRLLLHQKLPHLKCLKRLFIGHNTRFNPLEIKDDLVNAFKENYSLEEIMLRSFAESDPELVALQEMADHYCRMNISGRRIMACFKDNNNTKENSKTCVPLGLWPLILERANRIHAAEDSSTKVSSYAADAIFCLLLDGPIIHRIQDLVSQDNKSTSGDGIDLEGGCTVS